MPKVTKHQNNGLKKTFICSECPAEFNRKGYLNRHIKRVHKKDESYTCPKCHKIFCSLYSQKRHIAIKHTQNRPYTCKECPKSFYEACALKNHVDIVHLKKKPYTCPQCFKKFTRLNSIKRHIRIEHDQVKSFICTTCEKRFFTNTNLHRHYKSRTHKKMELIKKSQENQNKNPEIKANQTIMYDGSSKKLNLNNPSLAVVATTSNFNESSQADKTQEIYESQDILDLSIKKRKLDNSSLTVEDASSNSDNENADSSTTLADGICIEALTYMCLVDIKEMKPNFFKDCFWDRATGKLVEKDPAFVE